MNDWNSLALNPRVLQGYYTVTPPLDDVELHSVILHRDGPRLTLLVELRDFPDRPSSRWPAGANAAQVELRFFGVVAFEMQGWSATNSGALALSRRGRGIALELRTPDLTLVAEAEFFDVVKVTVYAKETAPS